VDLVPRTDRLTLDPAMARRRDVAIDTVIDVGASNGSWSARMMKHYPSARYLLIEAQRNPHEAGLKAFRESHRNVDFVLSAAGDRDGELYFDSSDPFGGLASEKPFSQNNVAVPAAKVDTLVAERHLTGPFLLKLDTHGYEVPILEGAAQTLENAAMLIIEAYNFVLCDGALRFYELCNYLEKRRFLCADLLEPLHRPGDGAFWQLDLVFLPESHSIFRSNQYREESS
jgi:FkbM family methyltransferase